MNIREAVVADLLARLAEEHGEEVLALDWSILEDIANSDVVPEKLEEKISP